MLIKSPAQESLAQAVKAQEVKARLALFSGEPAFPETLHVGRPNIGDRQQLMARIDDLLDRRWLTNRGPYVRELEEKLCAFIGVKHCITVCNATVGLELAIRAADLHGEVIVPSFTFIATAHSLQWQEITPVFCDVDPRTYNIDPAKVERLITPRTSGIIGVHLWGRACDVNALSEIAQRRGLKLLFDAAHAFACSHQGIMVGGFGNAEVFSFHATKFFNTFEGGAIATNDDELAEKVRLMSNFGFAGLDNVIYIGTNGKMSEVSAAMGLTSLESVDEFVEVNHRNYLQYRRHLDKIPGLSLIQYDQRERNNYQYIVVEVNEDVCGLSRDNLVQVLHAENVRARRYFHPGCHMMEPYRSYYPNSGLLLPETERLAQCVLCLPTGSAVDGEAIATICRIIHTAVENASEVRAFCTEKDSAL
jgi:dTDP-4-amino-4,6-dideoxygalactose transaminase